MSTTALLVIGSGNWSADVSGAMPAFLLTHEDYRLLIDCGSGTINRLKLLDIDPLSIDAIAVTHFHDDHFSDIAPLACVSWARKNRNEAPLRQPLVIAGPTGLTHRFERRLEVSGAEKLLEEAPPEIKEVTHSETSTEEISIGPFRLRGYVVNHVPDMTCFAWRVVTPEEKIIAFSGDAGPNQDGTGLRATLSGADIAIVEAGALVDSNPVHLTAEKAIQLATEAGGIKHLYFNHLGIPERRRVEDVLGRSLELKRPFKEVASLQDGNTFEL